MVKVTRPTSPPRATVPIQQTRKTSKEPRPPSWKVWLVAARPHTLTAAIAPCLVGTAITYANTNTFPTRIVLLWTCFCMLVQLGVNLHNDYADFVKGADTDARVGQSRATQKGWLTPQQTAQGATSVLMGNLVIGLYFLQQVQRHNHSLDGLFLFVVISSIFNAFAYTGGPYPLGYIGLEDFSIGYSGLGDVFVFVYFGCVATVAIPYLYDRTMGHPNSTITECLTRILTSSGGTLSYASIAVGLMATNILVVNNLRDRHTDIHAGKRTLAVRLGGTFCRVQYAVQALVSYLLVVMDFVLSQQQEQQHQASHLHYLRLLPLLSIPLAHKEIVAIWNTEGSALNKHVGITALLELAFCVLWSVGLVLSSRGST